MIYYLLEILWHRDSLPNTTVALYKSYDALVRDREVYLNGGYTSIRSETVRVIPVVEYSSAVSKEAQRLFYQHMQLDPTEHAYMWGQCSDEYREAWRIIAKENTDECTNSIITK